MEARRAAERRAARLVSGLSAVLLAVTPTSASQVEGPTGPKAGPVFFEDIVDRAGIDFVLKNSVTDHKFAIETMIGGVAVFDYDNDGLLDIYFANGALIPDQQRSELTLDSLDKSGPSFSNRLYRNNALERAKQCDDSVAILESYLQSDPTHRAARTSLADCYARQGRSEDAENAYRRVLAVKPDDSAAAMGLSRLLRSQGRAAKAREVLEGFQRAKRLSDAQAQAALALTIAKEAFGREQWSEAILQARRALDIEPDLAEGHAIVGAASLRAGDSQTARAAFERVLVLDPNHGSARAYLARVLESEGDYAGAVALLEKHMDLHPSHVPALFALCSLYQRQGALAKAELRIRAALESKPHNEVLLVMLREALAGLGRSAEALEVALQLAASNPSSSKHWSRVESLALSVGDQAALTKARAKLTDIHQ